MQKVVAAAKTGRKVFVNGMYQAALKYGVVIQVQPSHVCGPTSLALIALGANLPAGGRAPEQTIADAMARIAQRAGGRSHASKLYLTPAFPAGSGPDFVNAALALEWSGTAHDLLALLHGIEAEFGRTRTDRWEARKMDLDLLALGAQVLPDAATQQAWAALSPEAAARDAPDRLILPHPRMAERSFVLVPLAEVAPHWRHPVTGLSVADMLAARPAEERAEIRPLDSARDTPTG
jgi:2-amino-4-hydroxy-6-hydroxymethyldihydropteridine diphosphokinase